MTGDEDSEVNSIPEGNYLESPVLDDDDDGSSLVSDEEIPTSGPSLTQKRSPIDEDTEAAEFSAISEQSLKEDIEKGRAAKRQLGQ